ncbi:protein grindelwald [Microplitis mediator]|uniref:protein grindelwald n=1 Tax=Microplitis mediator TaxID=375433 RepID=UPI0025526F98|nr:protein grindelwald [Microplitis mediator]
MMLLNLLVFILVLGISESTLDPAGTKCGEKRCSTTEYCSLFDSQCLPCSSICDPTTHNHHLDLCVKDCQEYLHDQRYVLRADLGRDENLRDDVQKLGSLVKISLALTLITILAIIIFLVRTVVKFKKIRSAVEKIFGKKWAKNSNKNKIRDDIENVTVVKPVQSNVVISTLPTISAAVSSASSNSQDSNSISNNDSNGSSTPNTTSTSVSTKFASEDSTLEYAYDNPAMTPSPETPTDKLKSKRESSF